MFADTHPFSSFSVDDIAAAQHFYGEILGMTVETRPEGITLQLHGDDKVFVYPKGAAHEPASFTVLNFPVADVEAAVDALSAQGVQFEQYQNENIQTDSKGIAHSDGEPGHGPAAIAWFKDPAGNTLAILSQ